MADDLGSEFVQDEICIVYHLILTSIYSLNVKDLYYLPQAPDDPIGLSNSECYSTDVCYLVYKAQLSPV